MTLIRDDAALLALLWHQAVSPCAVLLAAVSGAVHGFGLDGRCYVVYQHVVKVGGSVNWRFNNQGSLGPRPADKEWPLGAIGYVPGGTDCGGRVGLLTFADQGASRQAVERWVGEAAACFSWGTDILWLLFLPLDGVCIGSTISAEAVRILVGS